MTSLIRTNAELKKIRSSFPDDLKISLVPTMGALHGGHLSLMKRAQELSDICFVSIFVNPLQFGPFEDFRKYPRDLAEDLRACEEFNVDYVFAPELEEIFPDYREELDESKLSNGALDEVRASPLLSNTMCGLARPGHFDGVCKVVKRFFDLVKPDLAVFGEKDYQQLLVIAEMVQRLGLPIDIVAAETVREESGLAKSSRNKYLSTQERELASNILKELQRVRDVILSGGTAELGANEVLKQARESSRLELKDYEIDLEYLEIFHGHLCIAAKLNDIRLIDNIELA